MQHLHYVTYGVMYPIIAFITIQRWLRGLELLKQACLNYLASIIHCQSLFMTGIIMITHVPGTHHLIGTAGLSAHHMLSRLLITWNGAELVHL